MPMIGGDLGAMDALARRFDAAGLEFRRQSAALMQRVAEAIDDFTTEMTALESDARALDQEIGAALGALRAQADATSWTGSHRDAQERALEALETDIRAVRASIERFLADCTDVVRGSLATCLADMQTDVDHAGRQAEHVASSFAAGVARQRAAFDLVMNG